MPAPTWAQTPNLVLDEDGRLWARTIDTDAPLGRVDDPEVPPDLEAEAAWLLAEWRDALDVAQLRAEARAHYRAAALWP